VLLGSTVKKLWRQISTVRPGHRIEFRMDRNLRKERFIFQRLEHGTPKLGAEITIPDTPSWNRTQSCSNSTW